MAGEFTWGVGVGGARVMGEEGEKWDGHCRLQGRAGKDD